MNFYAEEQGKKELNTTAAFIEVISKWFTLVTAWTLRVALGKTASNEDKEAKFESNIAFLQSVVELFQEIKIGHKSTFKPVQSGIIITTSSIIELTQYLVHERKYQYLLTGRLTQDYVENLFSTIRVKHPTPNALQFQQNLKLIAISQYLKSPQTSNYDKDEGQITGDFLNTLKKVKTVDECTKYTETVLHPKEKIHIDNIELNILYNIAGYLISSIAKCTRTCLECLDSVGSKQYDPNQKYSKLVQLRCFRKNTLFFVNNETFTYFYSMEVIIRQYISQFKNTQCNFLAFYMDKMKNITCNTIKRCHNFPSKIMKRFIVYRMRISCKKKGLQSKEYSSKTMAMHSIVK